MEERTLRDLAGKAIEVRKLTVDAMGVLGLGHIGGAMSIVEILTLLYFHQMHVDPHKPDKEERDRLILSKGHAGPALYSVLSLRGYFPKDWLHTLNQGGSRLPIHCDMNKTPGVDMSTGSLGLGLSTAIGMALGNRLRGINSMVYVILGDGEIDEGQIWEAAMSARQFSTGRLIAFIDYNKMQIDGTTTEIMDLEDIEMKWQSFGWHVQRVDGHDFQQINEAIEKAKAEILRPSVIVLDTIKGKGIFFAEGLVESHNMKFGPDRAREAIEKLGI